MEPGGRKGLKWLVLSWFSVYTLQAWQAVRADFWCLQSFSEISQWEHLILLSVVSPLTGCWGTFSATSSSKNTSPTSFCSHHLDPYQEDILGSLPFKIRPVYLPFSEPTSCPKDRQSDVLQQVEGCGSQHCPLLRCHGQLPSASFLAWAPVSLIAKWYGGGVTIYTGCNVNSHPCGYAMLPSLLSSPLSLFH